jgi:hypothetical protein
LIVDEVGYHGMASLLGGERRPFYPVFEPSELSAVPGYTTFCPEGVAILTWFRKMRRSGV